MRDLVSVVICCYKNTEYLYETLDSVFMQTYDNIEVVVSDDGSPGFVEDIPAIEAYFSKHEGSNITNYYINAIPVNGGTVKNSNSGISKAKGKYIMFPSPEDLFSTPETIAHSVDYMEAHPEFIIAFGHVRGVTPTGEYKYELEACESDFDLLKSYSVEDTLKRLCVRNFLPGVAWIAHREMYDIYGPYDEDIRLIEDYPYWLNLALKGAKFGYIDECMVEYKLTGGSSGGHYSEMFMKDMFVIYDKYIFPNDKRYGALQGLYNALKRGGLNYYMAEAKWEDMTPAQKLGARIKYLPFHVFVKMQARKVEKKNEKRKEQ